MRPLCAALLLWCASTVKLSADTDTNILHFGPEFVRMELMTNVVRAADAGYRSVTTKRILRVISEGITNELTLKILNLELEKIQPVPAPACSCQCCSGAKDIPIQVINGGFTNVIYSTNYYFFDPSTALITP